MRFFTVIEAREAADAAVRTALGLDAVDPA